MSSDIKKKLERIYSKIDKLAVFGKEKTQDYYLLVDDFINKGDYQYFELCLFYYYFIDVNNTKYVSDVKKQTWPEILLQTKSSFLKRLSKLYKTKNVYQQGFDVYSMNPNTIQLTLSNPLSVTYSIAATSSTINFNRLNDKINLSIVDGSTNQVYIYKAIWQIVDGVEKPTSVEQLQKIIVSTSSSNYMTEIPTTHGGSYLIKTQKRYTPGLTTSSFADLNYKLQLEKNSYLGQIKEIEDIDTTNYYLKDTKLLKTKKEVFTSIQIDKVGSTMSIFLSENNKDLTYDANLFNKYTQAINILLS